MPEHSTYCRKEAEIAQLEIKVIDLERMVKGNGQPGLAQTVPALSQTVTDLNETVGELSVGVRGLLRFQENELGIRKGKSIVKNRNRWIIATLITVVLGLATLLVKIHYSS